MADLFNPLIAGVAGGIVGAIIIFFTTLFSVLGVSKAGKFLETTVWKKLGYRVSGSGLIWGTILGFVYGFIIWLIFSLVYNSLI